MVMSSRKHMKSKGYKTADGGRYELGDMTGLGRQ
jgi:hypothetical protein